MVLSQSSVADGGYDTGDNSRCHGVTEKELTETLSPVVVVSNSAMSQDELALKAQTQAAFWRVIDILVTKDTGAGMLWQRSGCCTRHVTATPPVQVCLETFVARHTLSLPFHVLCLSVHKTIK